MAYISALRGYVTDVPELWLKRRDGRVFHFDKLSSSNVSPDTQFTEVNGGWSLYPIAYLPGQSTMEMSFESAQFDAELFSLANNRDFASQTVEVWASAEVVVDADGQTELVIESPKAIPATAKFYINGMTQAEAGSEGSAPAEGTFVVGESALNESTGVYETKITVPATELKKDMVVVVNYCVEEAHDTILVNNSETFVGEAILRWPVYSSGEETAAAGVKGYFLMHIFKCRVTAFPGFDTSLICRFLIQ